VSDAVVARYGGEEFVVLVPTQDQALAQRLAERIRSHLQANPFRAAEVHLPVTVSIGVASNRGRETLNSVIHQADECLYRAKKAGRDQVVFQGSMLVPV
jgi:diguanylate cyclase (GGDEF)-like protein